MHNRSNDPADWSNWDKLCVFGGGWLNIISQLLQIIGIIIIVILAMPFMVIGYIVGFVVTNLCCGYRWAEIHLTKVKKEDPKEHGITP